MSGGNPSQTVQRVRAYPRSRVAAALGISSAAAARLLPSHRADAFTLRGGGSPAWTLEAMPQTVRGRLEALATEAGRTVEEILSTSTRRWLTAAEIIRLDLVRYNATQVVRHYLLGGLFDLWRDEGRARNWDAGIETLPLSVQAHSLSQRVRRLCREFSEEHIDPAVLRTWTRRALSRGVLQNWRRIDPYMVFTGGNTVADREAIYLIHRFAFRHPGRDACLYHLGNIFSFVADLFNEARFLSAEEEAAVWQASFIHAATLRGRDGIDDPVRLRQIIVRGMPPWILRCISPKRSLTRKGEWQFIWQGHFEYWEAHSKLSPSLRLPTLACAKSGRME